MNDVKPLMLDANDFINFREWLDFNWDNVSWHKDFKAHFDKFWDTFFSEKMSLTDLMHRYHYAKEQIKTGPLSSWFSWLRVKNLCFIFIYYDISIHELAILSEIREAELSFLLRNFFVEKFPLAEDYFNSTFHVGNSIDENNRFCYHDIKEKLKLEKKFTGKFEDDILASLEITTYNEWNKFLNKMEKDFVKCKKSQFNFKERKSIKKNIRFCVEVSILLLSTVLLFQGIKMAYSWYDEYLSKKIGLWAPQLLLTQKSPDFQENRKVKKNFLGNEIKKMEVLESKKQKKLSEENEERFETETDIILSSMESIPYDFQSAELEHSEYEEMLKGGYRDERYGHLKVYRIQIKSVDVLTVREQLNLLLKKYEAIPGDFVRPGTVVPGGIYYNLLIPKKFLDEFLTEIEQVESSLIFVSRNRRGAPPGKAKVFVWIKEI